MEVVVHFGNYEKDFADESFDPEKILIRIKPKHTGTPILAAGNAENYEIRLMTDYTGITLASKHYVCRLPEEIDAADKTMQSLARRLCSYFPGITVRTKN